VTAHDRAGAARGRTARAWPRTTALGAAALPLALVLAGCSLEESPAATTTPTASASSSAATTSPEPTETETTETAEGTPTALELPPSLAMMTDEPSSSPSTPPVTYDATATLLFSGEVLMHQSLIDQAKKNGGSTYDFRPMFDEIKPLVAQVDLAVCHLELPVIPDGEGMQPRYAAPKQVIDALKYAGFDRCSAASNHAADRGVKGIEATIASFERDGMTVAGIADKPADLEPTVLDVNGIKVTHLSYTEVGGKALPTGQAWRIAMAERSRIVADVKRARALGAEYVMVSMHDAEEMQRNPTALQVKWDNWLIDQADVDLVIGTGSHVPETAEPKGDGFTLYSLGNLINWRLDARDSVLARVTIHRTTDGKIVTDVPQLIPTFTVESRGYQVLDARAFRTSRYDPDVRDYLRKSFGRVEPYVGPFVPAAAPRPS